MKKEELKPCPFCGGESEVVPGSFFMARKLYGVRCIGYCDTFLDCREKTPEKAQRVWNTRFPD